MDAQLGSITINGETYVKQDQIQSSANTLPSGNRRVIVVDRGWVWAGDVSAKEEFGQTFLVLSDAIHVLRWESIGFTGMLSSPASNKVTLKKSDFPVMIPMNSVISQHPVPENWGK
jgi:hypothetical protein